jgi:hypothetical protein
MNAMNRLASGFRLLAALTGLLGLPAAPVTGVSADGPSLEYQVKAAFLVKLAMFVEWPPGAFATAETPLCIGILGDDPFGGQFDEAVRQERVNGRPVQIHRAREVTELLRCQIVFVSPSEMDRLAEIIRLLAAHPVLTVGDHPRFASEGGAVNFIKEKGRVRFEVNRAAVERAGLRLSAKLLQVARVLEPGQKGGKS